MDCMVRHWGEGHIPYSNKLGRKGMTVEKHEMYTVSKFRRALSKERSGDWGGSNSGTG